jgi:hypothetical protein
MLTLGESQRYDVTSVFVIVNAPFAVHQGERFRDLHRFDGESVAVVRMTSPKTDMFYKMGSPGR